MNPIGLISFLVFAWMTIETLRVFVPLSRSLRKRRGQPASNLLPTRFPKTQVMLCLRGTDGYLDRCLSGLATQDHPDYAVTIVVDSHEDEAMPQALEMQAKYRECRVDIKVPNRVIHTCSRRSNSLISGMQQVDDDVEIMVLCDGDCVPHRSWLSNLIRPLVDEGALGTSGNRWYAPQSPTMGSLVRYYWNALAVPTMFEHGIPWAGSLAVRREVFTDPDFLNRIENGFSEDTQLANYLKPLGHRAIPQAELPVINEESITVSSFWNFVVRQMLAARLHHPNWTTVFTSAMVAGLAMWVLLPLSIMAGAEALSLYAAGMVLYGVVTHGFIAFFEWQVRDFVQTTRGQSLPKYGVLRLLMNTPALMLLGFIYPVAVLTATFSKTHVWRGITYHIINQGVWTGELRNGKPAIDRTHDYGVVAGATSTEYTGAIPVQSQTYEQQRRKSA